jgi:glycosyltransferase involved in cell wall biosynthesis
VRVALVDPSLFTWPYDAELTEALRGRGHDAILFGKALPARDSRTAAPFLRQHYYRLVAPLERKLPRRAFQVIKALNHVGSSRRLVRHLRTWRPDVIHVQWMVLPAFDRLLLPALRRIAPLVLTVHDTNPFNASPSARVQALGAIAAMRPYDHLIVHTDAAVERMMRYGLPRERISRIAHGLLHGPPAGAVPPAPTHAAGPVTFLQFGIVKPYKGVDIAIEAAALLSPELRARCRFRIVGRADMDTAPLLALAKARGVSDIFSFEFRFVPDAELPELFLGASALLFPYREIDASGVLLSALAWARPVLASRIGLFAEAIQDGVHGRLFAPEDASAMAAALRELIENPDAARRYGENVRALAATIPDWATIAQQTEAVYAAARRHWSAARR